MIASAFAAALSINPRSGGEYQRWRNLHNAELDASDYAEARAGGGILVVLPARSLLLSSRFSLLTASTIHSAHPPINRQSERRSSRQKCGCETTRNEHQNRQFSMFASIYRSAEIGAVHRSHSFSHHAPPFLLPPIFPFFCHALSSSAPQRWPAVVSLILVLVNWLPAGRLFVLNFISLSSTFSRVSLQAAASPLLRFCASSYFH